MNILTLYYIYYVILAMYMLDSDQEPSYNLRKKTFITAKDPEVDRRYGRWLNPPGIYTFACLQAVRWTAVDGFLDQGQISDIIKKYFGAATTGWINNSWQTTASCHCHDVILAPKAGLLERQLDVTYAVILDPQTAVFLEPQLVLNHKLSF